MTTTPKAGYPRCLSLVFIVAAPCSGALAESTFSTYNGMTPREFSLDLPRAWGKNLVLNSVKQC
jgi:hypothetical protein